MVRAVEEETRSEAAVAASERRESHVANDWELTEETSASGTEPTTGATTTLTRALSEADLALFALVMGEAELDTEAHLEAEPRYQRVAPPALLAALLTSCAARHSAHPGAATFLRAEMRFVASARAEETAIVRATVVGMDEATGALRIAATCEAEDGRRLADADFLLIRE